MICVLRELYFFQESRIVQTKRLLRMKLSEAQGHRCCYCGVALVEAPKQHNSATIEHVIPEAAGGWNGGLNLVVACNFCNEGRGPMLATSYFDLVIRVGREEANRLGRRWRKRIAGRNPRRLREKTISQHRRGKLYRVLAQEYHKRIAASRKIKLGVGVSPT